MSEYPQRSVRRWSRWSVAGAGLMVAAAVVGLVLPFVADLAALYSAIDLFILLILAVMWNLMAGYGGLVSIGQQAYIGVGAYGIVVLADLFGLNPFVALLAAAIICAIVSIPISLLAFRLNGGYFAVGTWVIAEVLRLVIAQVPAVGGGSGASVDGLSYLDPVWRVALVYWAALGCALIAVITAVVLVRSKIGLGLTAVRDDPVAAASSGVSIVRTKRIVFAVSAFGCGLAGGLIALSTLRVQPDSVFSVQWSAFMIFMVVIGGVGTLEGPIIGALVFFVLKETLADFGPVYLIALGVIGVAFALFARQGVWGLFRKRLPVDLFPVGYRVDLSATQYEDGATLRRTERSAMKKESVK